MGAEAGDLKTRLRGKKPGKQLLEWEEINVTIRAEKNSAKEKNTMLWRKTEVCETVLYLLVGGVFLLD